MAVPKERKNGGKRIYVVEFLSLICRSPQFLILIETNIKIMRLSRRITTVIRTCSYFITFVPRLKINRRYYIGAFRNIMNGLHFRVSVSSVRPHSMLLLLEITGMLKFQYRSYNIYGLVESIKLVSKGKKLRLTHY